MILYTPTKKAAADLVGSASHFGGMEIAEGALPPRILFEIAIAAASSAWLMPRLFVDERRGRVVGSGGFKGEPKEQRVEIGYGVAPIYRGQGYATEGVRLVCEEAFSSGFVSEILADTLLSNIASQRVLEKVGFTVFGVRTDEEGTFKKWRVKNAPNQLLDPTSPSVTPPAGAGGAPSVAADH
jgi:ribosomal protein S18 acetylase RimI-like enzyme